jgi:hypothetical protein
MEFTEGVVNPEDPRIFTPDVLDGLGNPRSVHPAAPASLRGPIGAATPVPNPIKSRYFMEDDTMSYAYPKYSNHPEVAAHVKQLWSVGAMNHGT